MAHASRRPDDDGAAVLFGNIERLHHVFTAFDGAAGLQNGQLRQPRIVPRVLLRLGGIHAGVVRDDNHHATDDADVGQRHHRIRRHVQTDQFHGHHASGAADRRASRRLHGHFFIRRPFAVRPVVFHEIFENLRRRGARITERGPHTGLPCATRQRLIA